MTKKTVFAVLCILVIIAFAPACKDKSGEPAPDIESTEALPEETQEDALGPGEPEEETAPASQTNSPPEIVTARILPETPYTNTDLRVEVETRDPDWDYVTCSYRWTVTTAGEEEAVEEEDAPTLSHEYFERGDTIKVEIVPNDGSSDGSLCLLSVRIANAVPEITSTPPGPFPTEGVYTYQVEAEDADGDDITFSLDEGAPPGVSIDTKSGLLTWRIDPALTGTHSISIRAEDGHQATRSQGFSVTLPGQ